MALTNGKTTKEGNVSIGNAEKFMAAFLITVATVGLTIGSYWAGQRSMIGPKTIELAETTVVAKEYEPIGNGISRTDDLEKGVSCYKAVDGSLSCVHTGDYGDE